VSKFANHFDKFFQIEAKILRHAHKRDPMQDTEKADKRRVRALSGPNQRFLNSNVNFVFNPMIVEVLLYFFKRGRIPDVYLEAALNKILKKESALLEAVVGSTSFKRWIQVLGPSWLFIPSRIFSGVFSISIQTLKKLSHITTSRMITSFFLCSFFFSWTISSLLCKCSRSSADLWY